MTRRKQGQRVLWEGMIEEDVRALWEPWMVQADQLLEEEELIERRGPADQAGGELRDALLELRDALPQDALRIRVERT